MIYTLARDDIPSIRLGLKKAHRFAMCFFQPPPSRVTAASEPCQARWVPIIGLTAPNIPCICRDKSIEKCPGRSAKQPPNLFQLPLK